MIHHFSIYIAAPGSIVVPRDDAELLGFFISIQGKHDVQPIDSELGIYNVGTGKGTTLNRLVAFISEIIPEALPPVYEQERPGDLRWNILCVDKLRALGWQPLVNMKEGISKLI